MADPDRDDPGENDTRPGMCGHVQTLQPDGTWRDPIGRRYAPPPGYKKVAQVAYEARVAQEEAEVARSDARCAQRRAALHLSVFQRLCGERRMNLIYYNLFSYFNLRLS